MLAYAKRSDGAMVSYALVREEMEDGFRLTLPGAKLGEGIEYVDFLPGDATAREGDEGYMALPHGQRNQADMLVYFRGHEPIEYESGYTVMPMFGFKTKDRCFVAIFDGMRYEHSQYVSVRDGVYSLCGRFLLEGQAPYEDLSIEYHLLPLDAEYSDMCRVYRERQLARGACVRLDQRMNPERAYAAGSPEVRIRLAWKPAPSPIPEQTVENEPPMHVAATFDRVGEILDELRAQGVEKAEICLVGWNLRGHDGRYPQMFPVEPALGGEEGLRRLIAKAQKMGYQIVCHTNSTDCYSIAEDWDPDVLPIVTRDGQLSSHAAWSGGKMYNMCPHAALPLAERDLPRVAALGFRGLHYIDVVGVVPPRKCFSRRHPATRKQYVDVMRRIMSLSSELFGGFMSEGCYDFCADGLDYGLYTAFNMLTHTHPLCDRLVPLWQLVYHGIILSNPTTETVNYPIKDARARLKVFEYGGRPTFYIYSKFVTPTDGHWMGREDLTCDGEEDLKRTAQVIAQAWREFQPIRHLQTRLMERHEYLTDEVTLTTYEGGERVVCNGSGEDYCFEGRLIPAGQYLYLGGSSALEAEG